MASMRALCASILVPILLLSGLAEAKGPTSLSRRDLIRVVPECRHPGLIRAPECRKAAEILDHSPREASEIYLENWRQVAFRGHVVGDPSAARPSGGGGSGGGNWGSGWNFGNFGNCGGSSGDGLVAVIAVVIAVVIIVVAVVLIVQGVKALHRAGHDARVRAADRITTRALRAVYEQSAGDPYADTMLDALSDSNYRSQSSWLRFSEIERTTTGP